MQSTCRRYRLIICLLTFGGLAGCQAPESRMAVQGEREPEFGPPPPGYIKIVGEPVPNWKPADMLRPRSTTPGLIWEPLGPRPVVNEVWSGNDDASGRVVSIAPHPSDPDTVYIASASGGIWKTADAGALWTPLTDELSILNHGCVALDPSDPDIVYAGTGEYTTSSNGDGLFRSTDGGSTWVRIATTSQVGRRCSRIIVDPIDTQRIHVTGSRGYVRSTDGGSTWVRPLAGAASDLAVNPVNPSVLFVARHSDGIYRSTDGGDTLTKLTTGLPSTDVRRIVLAMAPSNPDTVYAAIINSAAGLRGLYKTVDGGDSWIQKTNTPNFPSPQGWYDVFLGVDPGDENTVYGGGVFPSYAVAGIIKTTNGGDSWTDISYGSLGLSQVHPDQHAIAFGPTGTVWVGNDGGVWKSDDDGAHWINVNGTLTVTQNYNIALHPTDDAQVIGGTQDNGTVGRDLPVEQWPQVIGGDGGFAAWDFAEPFRKYTTYVYLTVYRFTSGSFANITGPWVGDGDAVNFIAPLVMDPNDSRTLLGGTNRVWRTNNAHTSATWTAISDSSVAGTGRLNAIAVAEGASNTIYTGSTLGAVYVTTDGSTWTDRSSGLPSNQVSDIMIDPSAPGTAYVSFYRTSGARVLRTDDFGVNWTSTTGDLPSGVSARALAVDWRFDPPTLFVGSGAGIYVSFNGGLHWIKDGADLPNVNIGDLAIDTSNQTITAGTYGRGAWRADISIDCNTNGILDQDEIAQLITPDCNLTGTPDDCDIASGESTDTNGDGVPDECTALPALQPTGLHGVAKNRYLSFEPNNLSDPVAFKVDLVASEDFPASIGELGWVGTPDVNGVAQIVPTRNDRVWDEPVVHVADCRIVPVAGYEVRAIREIDDAGDPARFSNPLTIETAPRPGGGALWADCTGGFGYYCTNSYLCCDPNPDCPGATCAAGEQCQQQWPPPDGATNFNEVQAAIRKFQALENAPHTTWVDLHGAEGATQDPFFDPPNYVINFSDVQQMIKAFQGEDYPYSDPAGCP